MEINDLGMRNRKLDSFAETAMGGSSLGFPGKPPSPNPKHLKARGSPTTEEPGALKPKRIPDLGWKSRTCRKVHRGFRVNRLGFWDPSAAQSYSNAL